MGQWFEVCIEIGRECEEAAGELLSQLGAAGFSVEDPRLAEAADVRWLGDYWPDVHDEGLVVLKGYFGSPVTDKDLLSLEHNLRSLAEFGLEVDRLTIKTRTVDEEDWAHAWKQHYHTETYGRIVVRPVWEDYQPQAQELVIAMDPGMAFGTGGHPTTNMCLRALQDIPMAGRSFWDVGTGSGILSCAAGRLGADPITACDIDPTAVEICGINAARNGIPVQCVLGTIDDLPGRADVIAANIIADVIVPMVPTIPQRLTKGGHFVASGIIAERVQDVQEALRQAGMTVLREWQQGEWYCVLAAI